MSLKAKPFPTTEIKEDCPNPSLPFGTAILYFSASLPLHLWKSHGRLPLLSLVTDSGFSFGAKLQSGTLSDASMFLLKWHV